MKKAGAINISAGESCSYVSEEKRRKKYQLAGENGGISGGGAGWRNVKMA